MIRPLLQPIQPNILNPDFQKLQTQKYKIKENHPKIPMFSTTILITYIITTILTQQCQFPNQRCICMTTTPLCRCSYITTDSTLNFTSSYKSHLVAVSGMGCLPCPASCLQCTSLSVCTLCLDQFVLVGGSCVVCSINCKKCRVSTTTSTTTNTTILQCYECIQGYYLDSKSQCQTCPLQGSQQCTADTIISCLSSYWLDNNGANCIKCDSNCRQCSSTTKCSICNDGYYLSAYRCWKCMTECLLCGNATACTKCAVVGKYWSSSAMGCLACGDGCLQCVNATYCTTCGDSVYNQYTLTNNNTCIITQQSVQLPNCLQNKPSTTSTTSTLKCTKCQPDYYQEIGESECHYGCSILCKECQGAHYGLCTVCKENSYLFNRHCLVKNNINGGTAYQFYISSMHFGNYLGYFSGIIPSVVTRLMNSCLRQSIAISAPGSPISIKLNNLQSYRVVLTWKLYITKPTFTSTSTNTNTQYQVNFTNTNTTTTTVLTCTNNLPETNCTNICISKSSLDLINSDVLQLNTLVFLGLGENVSVGLAELLVVGYRCGGVQGYQCLECSEINVCTKCVNPLYFILAETCIQECPPTYYINYQNRKCYRLCPLSTYNTEADNGTKLCQICPPQCQTCLSTEICISCSNGYYLYEKTQQCIQLCPDRYFANQYLRKCQKCPFPCLGCRSNRECLSCIYGFYDGSTGGCTVMCGVGFYGDLDTRVCQACESPCLSCQVSSTNCVTCLPGFIQFYRQCLQSCPTGYHLITTPNKQCIPCPTTCSACLNQTYCTACISGYLYNNKCQSICPLSYYPNILTQQCVSCGQDCVSCTNLSHCLLCGNGKFLDEGMGVCVEICGELEYPQQQAYSLSSNSIANKTSLYYTCKPCIPPCHKCLNYSYCLSCISSFLLSGSCIENCIEGTYPNQANLTCTKCSQNCLYCQSETMCSGCANGWILFENRCIESCPESYYLDRVLNICMVCGMDCVICETGSYCLECAVGLFRMVDDGQCVKYCLADTYPNNQTKTCINCPQYCSKCLSPNSTGTPPACLQCQTPYSLNTQTSSCTIQCPQGQFGLNGLCLQCYQPCASCVSQSQCQGCLDGYGYALLGDCLAECPLGYYGRNGGPGVGGFCRKCPENCIECWSQDDSSSAPICQQCKQNYYLYKPTGQCLTPTQCSQININTTSIPQYYAAQISRICQKCSTTCLHCINQSHICTSCRNGYYLYALGYQCLMDCPMGFYEDQVNNLCLGCNGDGNGLGKCLRCVGMNLCQQCSNGYFLYTYNTTSSICLEFCPVGYYGYATKCSKCKYPCLECTSPTNCTKCSQSYIQLSTPTLQSCLSHCPNTYYKHTNPTTSTSQCLPCQKHCLQCTQNQCTVCDASTVLVDSTCVSDCPIAMYKFYGGCLNCMYGCRDCNDSYSCNVCVIGFLFQGSCVKQCPYGLIPVSINNISSCIPCSTQCRTCKIQPQICTSCQTPLYLYLQSCIPTCVSGTYAVPQLHQCITCTKPCQTCINSHSCQTCIYGYILYAEQSRNQCVKGPLCPNSYYLDVAENYCKIGCQVDQFTELISRTCSKYCPEGFAAYRANMTCLYECPRENMYIDSNNTCQQNRSNLGEQFVLENLPYFSCNSSNYKSLLQIVCYFSLPISRLDQLEKNNIQVEDMEILAYFVSNQSQILQIYAQPARQSKSTKFVKKWMRVSLRPRYKLRYQVPIATTSSRNLQQISHSYPLQNSDANYYLTLFNFYTEQQRSTGQYLGQLANGISIAALIIWVFSFMKNKKSISLVWITGLQQLYMISTLSDTQYPPHVLHFMHSFKTSLLIFIGDGSQDIGLGGRLWVAEDIRMGLLTPINLMDFMTISVPVVGFVGGFVGLILVLVVIRAISDRLSVRYEQSKQKNDQNQQYALAKSKQSKNLHSKTNQNSDNNLNKSIKTITSSKTKKSNKSHPSSHKKIAKNPYSDLSKKLSILLQRFKSNYLHHLFMFISAPCSLLLGSQLLAPQPTGLMVAGLLLCLFISLWAFTVRELSTNKFPLFKQQGYKYFLLTSIQNFIFGLICIIGSVTHFMGISLVTFIFNLYVYCAIFHRREWKLIFWSILQLTKIAIVGSLIVCIQISEVRERDQLFSIGWCPVMLMVGLVIMLGICAARDFFQQESIAFRELKAHSSLEKKNDQKQKPLLEIPQNQLNNGQPKNGVNFAEQTPEISSLQAPYESQSSFFEDEEEQAHTDSEDDNFSETQIKRQNNAPKMLIKFNKDT